MDERRFVVTKEEDTFLVGHFADEHISGVYLSPEYIERLRQIRHAVAARVDALGVEDLPDALKNPLGIVDRLTGAHAAQPRSENGPPSAADTEEVARVEQEMAELKRELDGLPRGPNGPPRK